MKRYLISILMGLLSITSISIGVKNVPSQGDTLPVKVEETVVVVEEETEKETIEEVVVEVTEETIEEIHKESESTKEARVPETRVPQVTKEPETQATKTPETTAPTAPAETKPAPTTAPVETKPQVEEESQASSGYASQVLELVNQERTNQGLSALTTDSSLTAAANKRAVEIVSSFSHTRPDGSSCFTVFDEFGISPQTGGENIAYGQKTPAEVVEGWMNSQGHRENILNPKFTKLGVGVHTQNGVIYWSQLFTG